MKWLLLCLLFAEVLAAQESPKPTAAEQEQTELTRAVGEAGSSPVDFTRALEKHLAKYPTSAQRPALEKALAKAAIENGDRDRTILYGERVLAADPNNTDLQLMDRVIRALLETDSAELAQRALPLTARYLTAVEAMRRETNRGHMTEAQWGEEVDRGRARALVLQARATGNAGDKLQALGLAKAAWDTMPGSEAALENARWLTRLDRNEEALEYLADSFTIEDNRATEAERARTRARLGELYTKVNGSEKGLGDLLLAAYDRMATLQHTRSEKLRAKDPNAGVSDLMQFTLAPVGKEPPLSLAGFKGKTIVMDFWATWCGPCRVQHPMVEKVHERFAKDPGVVFLAVNSDEDHSLVKPFLKELKWDSGANYYESGLSRMLNVNSIPTLLVINREGKVSSRMVGFIPERFEDMLIERIEETRSR